MTHHYHASVAYLERGASGLHGGRRLADGCANGDDLNDRVNDVVPLELRLVVSDLLDLGPVHVEALQQLQRPLPVILRLPDLVPHHQHGMAIDMRA
jgi:hypothetical protein